MLLSTCARRLLVLRVDDLGLRPAAEAVEGEWLVLGRFSCDTMCNSDNHVSVKNTGNNPDTNNNDNTGWHYLSNATCLIRPRCCCYVSFVVSGSASLACVSPKFEESMCWTSSFRQVAPPDVRVLEDLVVEVGQEVVGLGVQACCDRACALSDRLVAYHNDNNKNNNNNDNYNDNNNNNDNIIIIIRIIIITTIVIMIITLHQSNR